MKVGKNILETRCSHNLTQEQFGQLFHVTRQTVSNWEKEKSFPDLQTLIDISDKFDLSLDLLIKDDSHFIQTIDRQRRFAKRGIWLLIAIIFVIAALSFIFGGQGTPNEERNRSETDASVYLNLPDQTPSRAIVRTFDKAEWEQFSKCKRGKIIDGVSGRIAGDMPCLHVLPSDGNPGQNPKIRPVFQDLYQNNHIPDQTPKIMVTAYENSVKPYLENKDVRQKKWQAPLHMDEDGYYFQLESPFGDYDQYGDEVEFVPCLLEFEYAIEGKEYISLSAVNL